MNSNFSPIKPAGFYTLRQKYAKRIRLYLFLLVIIGIPMLLGLSALLYFFTMGYDVPWRVQGHVEKNVISIERPFALSPDGTYLVYHSPATGKGDLYRMDIEGKNVRQLTTAPDYESAPSFSPDGRWILFCRETNYCGHIWKMASDGSAKTQVTFGSDYDTNPLYTPDGKNIWFERIPQGSMPGHDTVFTMTAEGKQVAPLDTDGRTLGHQAAFSTTNDSVYYVAHDPSTYDNHIWRMRSDRTGKRELAKGSHPAVSPKGDKIAYVFGPFDSQLWIMETDGTKKRLVYESEHDMYFVAFSPDGRSLFVMEYAFPTTYISRVDLDGSGYRRIQK